MEWNERNENEYPQLNISIDFWQKFCKFLTKKDMISFFDDRLDQARTEIVIWHPEILFYGDIKGKYRRDIHGS